jgi:hypothetical protein
MLGHSDSGSMASAVGPAMLGHSDSGSMASAPIPDSRFPIPDSRFKFPIPDSRFPIPDCQVRVAGNRPRIIRRVTGPGRLEPDSESAGPDRESGSRGRRAGSSSFLVWKAPCQTSTTIPVSRLGAYVCAKCQCQCQWPRALSEPPGPACGPGLGLPE